MIAATRRGGRRSTGTGGSASMIRRATSSRPTSPSPSPVPRRARGPVSLSPVTGPRRVSIIRTTPTSRCPSPVARPRSPMPTPPGYTAPRSASPCTGRVGAPCCTSVVPNRWSTCSSMRSRSGSARTADWRPSSTSPERCDRAPTRWRWSSSSGRPSPMWRTRTSGGWGGCRARCSCAPTAGCTCPTSMSTPFPPTRRRHRRVCGCVPRCRWERTHLRPPSLPRHPRWRAGRWRCRSGWRHWPASRWVSRSVARCRWMSGPTATAVMWWTSPWRCPKPRCGRQRPRCATAWWSPWRAVAAWSKRCRRPWGSARCGWSATNCSSTVPP